MLISRANSSGYQQPIGLEHVQKIQEMLAQVLTFSLVQLSPWGGDSSSLSRHSAPRHQGSLDAVNTEPPCNQMGFDLAGT